MASGGVISWKPICSIRGGAVAFAAKALGRSELGNQDVSLSLWDLQSHWPLSPGEVRVPDTQAPSRALRLHDNAPGMLTTR
jgi:hypothetical protein